jgi:hypothetical protein
VRAAPQSLGLEWVLTGRHVPSQSSAWVASSLASWMIALRVGGESLVGGRQGWPGRKQRDFKSQENEAQMNFSNNI